MTIAILADLNTFEEITAKGFSDDIDWIRADSLKSLIMIEADAYFDLKFEHVNERVNTLRQALPKPVFINAVADTLAGIGEPLFTRINAWPGMINRDAVELVPGNRDQARQVMERLG
ncbi:MAG: hypothetical protein EOO02_04350, partial [Chitinophagaceae bacterium]